MFRIVIIFKLITIFFKLKSTPNQSIQWQYHKNHNNLFTATQNFPSYSKENQPRYTKPNRVHSSSHLFYVSGAYNIYLNVVINAWSRASDFQLLLIDCLISFPFATTFFFVDYFHVIGYFYFQSYEMKEEVIFWHGFQNRSVNYPVLNHENIFRH